MHNELLIPPLVLHGDIVAFNILVLARFVREVSKWRHIFVNCRQDRNKVVQQENVRNENMEDEHTSVHILIFSQHTVVIVTKHSVEEGTERDYSVDVHYRVFLE